jgi:hypothetical protein
LSVRCSPSDVSGGVGSISYFVSQSADVSVTNNGPSGSVSAGEV